MATGAKSEDIRTTEIAVPLKEEPSKDTKVTKIASSQEQGSCKGVEEKGASIEGVKAAEENDELKKGNESKTGEVVGMVEKKKDEAGEITKGDDSKTGEVVVLVGEKKDEADESGGSNVSSPSPLVQQSTASFKEESNLLSDLKEHEKKALFDLRTKIEEAVLVNKLFKEKREQVEEPGKAISLEEEAGKTEKPAQEDKAEERSEAKAEKEEENVEKKDKSKHEREEKIKIANEGGEQEKTSPAKENVEKDKSKHEGEEKIKIAKEWGEQEKTHVAPPNENVEKKDNSKPEGEEKIKISKEGVEQEKTHVTIEEKVADIDEDIALWRVPLLPRKGDTSTDVILLKFLRAREFKANEAFEMLKSTLQWRKEYNIDSILGEDFGADLASVAYMNGVDREGHPVCYNMYGLFGNDEVYSKTFETEEKCEKFLRWRFQLMEKGIQKLNFKPGCATSLLQINDLKNTPGPSKKELRLTTKRAIGLLQDNYPEFVARNIFVNVPFWYYAFNALLSPFLTQRTKSKFVFARPAKVTETMLKYIAAEEIPVHYGGLKQENDSDFSVDDGVSEVLVKAGSTETIEIPAPEVSTMLIWDLTVLGWEVSYKEEFIPTDEGSYTIVVSKGRKMGWQEGSVRNSFRNNEPGKVVLKIKNGSFKKKRILFRYKTKNSSSSY